LGLFWKSRSILESEAVGHKNTINVWLALVKCESIVEKDYAAHAIPVHTEMQSWSGMLEIKKRRVG